MRACFAARMPIWRASERMVCAWLAEPTLCGCQSTCGQLVTLAAMPVMVLHLVFFDRLCRNAALLLTRRAPICTENCGGDGRAL